MKRSLLVVVLILLFNVILLPTDVAADPPAPTNIQASDGTMVNFIRVTWGFSPGATYYKVYRGYPLPKDDYFIATVTGPIFDDTTALHDTRYYYRVSACDSSGCNMNPLDYDSGYVGLAEPTHVEASDGNFTDRVWLNWDEVDGATGYQVRTGDNPGSYFKTTATVDPWLSDYDLDPGVLYYFWVRATNSLDESSFSPYETGFQGLDEPSNVQATDGAYCDRTRVSWNAVEGATSYKVRRGDTSVGWDQEWTVTGSTIYDDHSGTAFTTYYYRVSACADVGCGNNNSDQGYREGPPLAPEGTEATDALYPNRVRVYWDAVDEASSYLLQRSQLPDPYETIAEGIVATQYDDTDVVQGRTYYYRVAACNACGCGSYGPYDYGSAYRTTATPTRTLAPAATPTSTGRPAVTPTSTGTPTPTPTPDHGPWDADRVAAPRVIHDTDGYRMWYDGYNDLTSEWRVGLARSSDGCTWWKHAGNPVLGPGDEGAWDSGGRMQVSVFKGSSVYKMWYSAHAGGVWQTGYATSPDGMEWDAYAGNPVLRVGESEAWDELEADAPAVIKDGGVYKMWYHGCNEGYESCSIGYATSPDGKNWTKHVANPVLEGEAGEWDEGMVASPAVIRNGGGYEMWYWGGSGIGRATSSDGIHWTKEATNPVLSEGWNGQSPAQPFVLLEGDIYKMWFRQGATSDSSIGYAESTDGIHWTLSDCNPVLIPGPMGGLWLPMIVRE